MTDGIPPPSTSSKEHNPGIALPVTPDLYPHVTPSSVWPSRSIFEQHQAQIRTGKGQFNIAQAELRVTKHGWSNEKHKPPTLICNTHNT